MPVTRFFAPGHGEFAVSVPGGHSDIFREKIFLIFLFFSVFFPYLYSFCDVFSPFLYFSLSLFLVLVLKSRIIPKEGNYIASSLRLGSGSIRPGPGSVSPGPGSVRPYPC